MSAEQVGILSLDHRQPALTVCLHSPSLLCVFRDRRASWPFSWKMAYPTRPTPHPHGSADPRDIQNIIAQLIHLLVSLHLIPTGLSVSLPPLHSSAGASVGHLSMPWRKASRRMVPTALLPPSATGYVLIKQAAVCTQRPSDFKPRCSVARAKKERQQSQTADPCCVFTDLESHLPYAHCHAETREYGNRDKGLLPKLLVPQQLDPNVLR